MKIINPDNWQLHDIESIEDSAWEALKCEANCSIIAGPGSGKTELLAQKASFLLETNICSINQKILAISFKTDAAKNLEERLKKRCPNYAHRFVSMTFDAFTKNILDRFRLALPENIRPNSQYEIVFGRLPVSHAEMGNYKISSALNNDPIDKWVISQIRDSKLQFPLINRLAEYIICKNIYIQRALRQTYPFVFVDEFQDTTYLQYDFLKTAFKKPNLAVTAVGDPQQRIMGWAGATENAFQEFESDFNATKYQLYINHRSTEELIEVQQVIAYALNHGIDSALQHPFSLNYDPNPRVEIWNNSNKAVEKNNIGTWIDKRLKNSDIKPSEIAILLKQQVDDFIPLLEQEFGNYSLKVRNMNEKIGQTNLQDLLKEDITQIILAFIKHIRANEIYRNWNEVREYYYFIKGIDQSDQKAMGRADRNLNQFVISQKSINNPVEILKSCINFLDVETIKAAYHRYREGDLLNISLVALKTFFQKSASSCTSWKDFIEEVEGVNHIPVMTIHKSKGLEFDTVFLLGLDDQNWWSFRNDQQETLSTFFVALSRAKNYMVFNYCSTRGCRNLVRPLYELLFNANIQINN